MQIDDALAKNLHVLSDPQRAATSAQRQAFLETFPLNAWPDLTLERYALGTAHTQSSFSYALEWGTPDLGSIRGGAASKHLIFRAKKDGQWRFPAGYADVAQAWTEIRGGFVEAFDRTRDGQAGTVDEIAVLRQAKVVKLKSLYLYFPDELLPVYSQTHLEHFAHALALAPESELVALNRQVLARLRTLAPDNIDGGLGLAQLLYRWAPPPGFDQPAYVKIAPGEQASLMPECFEHGYICVGWDEVGDLALFESKDEFRSAFQEQYPYNGHAATVSRKSNEVWRLTTLRPGDQVVANRGTSEVVAIGTVVEPGYQWRPERDHHQHTVTVQWDTSRARHLDSPSARGPRPPCRT